MLVNGNKYSLIWAEIAASNALAHQQWLCFPILRISSQTPQYCFTSKRFSFFFPFHNCPVTWSLSLHLFCLFDLHFSASLFLQKWRSCNCAGAGRRCANRWWTFAIDALGWRGRGKRKTLPRSKKLSSNFQKNQAPSAVSLHRFPNFCHADLRQNSPNNPRREVLSMRCQCSAHRQATLESQPGGENLPSAVHVRKSWVSAYLQCLPLHASLLGGTREQGFSPSFMQNLGRCVRARVSAGAYRSMLLL